MKIKSICQERAQVIHEVTETDGSHSLEFYDWGYYEVDGIKVECRLFKGIYDHKTDTLTLYWQRINRE